MSSYPQDYIQFVPIFQVKVRSYLICGERRGTYKSSVYSAAFSGEKALGTTKNPCSRKCWTCSSTKKRSNKYFQLLVLIPDRCSYAFLDISKGAAYPYLQFVIYRGHNPSGDERKLSWHFWSILGKDFGVAAQIKRDRCSNLPDFTPKSVLF